MAQIKVAVMTLLNSSPSHIWMTNRASLVAPDGYHVTWECDRCAVITTGRNLQLKRAIRLGYDRVIFVDSDVILSQDGFNALVRSEHDIEGLLYGFRSSVVAASEGGLITEKTLVGAPFQRFNFSQPKTLLEYLTKEARHPSFFQNKKTDFFSPAWWCGAGALSVSLRDSNSIVPFQYYRIQGCDTGEDLTFGVLNRLAGRSVMARYISGSAIHVDFQLPDAITMASGTCN